MISPTVVWRLAMAWCAVALVVFAVLATTTGFPQGPEGDLIAGTLQVRIQIGLLAVAAIGLLLALRWPVLGGIVIVVAAAGVGVFAAFEYHPIGALAPFLALVIPGAMLIGGGLWGRPVAWAAAAATGLLLVFAGAGVAADRVHDYLYGPTHPESTVRLGGGPVEWIWSGAPDSTGARVTARLRESGASGRLLVGARADLAGPVRRIDPSSSSEDGAVLAFDVHGLQPGRVFHYALEIDGRLDRSRIGRLRTVPDGPASFTVAIGGCARSGSNGAVFDAIREGDPDLYLINGDMYYGNIDVADEDLFRDALDQALTRPAQQALYLSTRVAYIWDDHDYGPNDADASSPTRAAVQAVYRQYVPHGALPGGTASGPVYQAFTMGRVRFVIMDLRSERSPSSAPDGPGKSMLGASQRRWLEAEMLRARDRHQLVALVSSAPWIAPARAGADDWAGYAVERRSLSRFVARERIQTVMLAGDAHMVALDDGSHTDFSGTGRAGFPLMHAAALDRHGGLKGGPYSAGAFPGSGQYGTMRVRDDGRRLRVTLRGLDWEGRQLVGQTFTFAP